MKRSLLITILTFIASACFAQSDPIKFLGVPIDGTQDEFYSRLMDLGFKDGNYQFYTGPFIGESVDIYVDYLMEELDVYFRQTPVQRISAVYNQLLKLFREDNQFFSGLKWRKDYKDIPENEVLSPETVANSKYYAFFLYYGQCLEDIADAIADKIFSEFMSEGTLKTYRQRMKWKENLEDLNEFVHDELYDAYHYSVINEEKYDTLRDSFSKVWLELSGGLVLLIIEEEGPQVQMRYYTRPMDRWL